MRKFLSAAVAALAFSHPAAAAVLVDTGAPPQHSGGSLISPTQWLSAQFSLSSAAVVGTVQGFIASLTPGHSLRTSIYTDGGNIPGSAIFSANFVPAVSNGDWQGVSGLTWALAAGSYWVSFETDDPNGFSYMDNPAPNPLGLEAARNNGGPWVSNCCYDIGVRIFDAGSTAAPIPETATWAMMIAGFGMVGGAMRSARRRTTVTYATN